MSQRTLLLFSHVGTDPAIIGRTLRDAGYLVLPSRSHETGVDAMVRVQPEVVLVDAKHYVTVVTRTFQDLAREMGAMVLIVTRKDAADDSASLREIEDLPYPMIEYSGAGTALAGLVNEVHWGKGDAKGEVA